MDLSLQTTHFLYRLRYKLLIPSLFVAFVVTYFTQFLPKEYTVVSSVFTGIASNKGLDSDDRIDYLTLANTFDNVINITKSKSSLENVSIQLLAQNLMYGDELGDNEYITAKNYIKLLKITPKEVIDIIDRSSLDSTLSNLKKYKQSKQDNFISQLLNTVHRHYSYSALNEIRIRRVSSSDLIELSYSSDDPGIAFNTVELITAELIISYHTFKYRPSESVVAYYEKELRKHKAILGQREDLLMNYNVKWRVTNYAEQTKALAIRMSDFDSRYESVLMEYASSNDLMELLDEYMRAKSQLYSTNGEFLHALDQISTINGKIVELEMFNIKDSLSISGDVVEQRRLLLIAEKNIEKISNEIQATQYSKEGAALDDVVDQWLSASVNNVKTKAELRVLEDRKKYYAEQQNYYSPIGTRIKRMERDIRVTEESYLNVLHHLGLANQRKNGILLMSASPEILSPASYPIRSNGRKRYLYILVAFVATFLLIAGVEIFIELVDRTLRDHVRAKQLTSLEVFGGFLGRKQFKYRGYTRDSNRISARSICNKLNKDLNSNNTIYINIFSIENSEGKSYVSEYMRKEWEEQGLKVESFICGDNYLCDANYLRAESFDFFKHEPADVVLIEYPSLSQQSIPLVFLRDASANIMVINACRGWRTSDDEYIKYFRHNVDREVVLILNNANRDYIEYLVGELLVNNENSSISEKLKHLAFTSEGNGVK